MMTPDSSPQTFAEHHSPQSLLVVCRFINMASELKGGVEMVLLHWHSSSCGLGHLQE